MIFYDYGGRGASSFGSATKGGKLRKGRRGKPSEQLDVSNLQNFPVNLKNEFEDFMDMKNNEVEYGYLIDPNGKVVAGARGGKTSVGVRYDGSQEGFDLTHNHPDAFGGTFSGADISHLTEAKLHSIRAVAREGTYTMTAKKNADFDGFNRALAKDLQKIENKGAVASTKARDKGKSKNEIRKAFCDAMDDWYSKNASKYGFEYKFKPNKGYDINAKRKIRK